MKELKSFHWHIKRNFNRYPKHDKEKFPRAIIAIGTKEQAINLAEFISDPGCNYMYYVEGIDDES